MSASPLRFVAPVRYNRGMVNWPRLNILRPRYSLRLLLVCLAILAIATAVYRDPLRRRVEAFLARAPKQVKWLEIQGPQTSGFPPQALDPPNPQEIASVAALPSTAKDLRIVAEKVSDFVDPPELTPTGRSQLHHARYKCVILSSEGTRTVHIDHVHRCLP